jgi:hypothetical protein
VLIHFPDGNPRPVTQARLYVDGVVVDERQEPPFEVFNWDLSSYSADGQHSLQVEAVDSLGMRGASILTPVQVIVNQPEVSPLAALLPRWPVILALAVLVLAAVLILFLILGGRISPQAALARQRTRPGAQPWMQPEAQPDDGLEAVKYDPSGRRLQGWVNRLHWPQRRLSPNASAFLVHLPGEDETNSQAPIPITANELTFGRDVHQASLVLDDPSLDGLHARLVRDEDGCFHLADEGSIAGTWINYTPVPQEPAHQRKPVILREEQA